jgi:superfamily II DNA or RNA helicase
MLSDYDWNKRLHIYELMNRYYTYVKSKQEFLIPAAYTDDIIREITALNAPMNVSDETLVKGRKIKLKMQKWFQPKPNQVEAIDYLVKDNPPYNKGLSLMTGGGKTVVAIAAIVKRGMAAMVITSGLTEQWYQSFIKFTNAKQTSVVVVQGVQSLMKLMESDIKPDVIIFSLETLRRYVAREENYRDLPPYSKFISYFGIDTKIVDECHLNFKTNTHIDLRSNIKNNVYLTATFTSSNHQTRKIFNKIYPVDMRFGASVRDRYIDIWSYSYRFFVPDKCYAKLRGYSHVGYEKYFYKRPTKAEWFFQSVLVPVINDHYDNRCKEGARCLIFFATLDMIDLAYKFLKEAYPNRKVGIYVGESDPMECEKLEIIVSNAKKAGTGKDISELYTVVNTISYASPTLTEQMLGRLRKLPDGSTPHYIEVVNLMCQPHIHHKYARQMIHKRLAREYHELYLP